MEDIAVLSQLRGKLVCNKDYPLRPAERRAMLSVRDWCVKYFVLLNNNLCSKGAKNKAVTAPKTAAAPAGKRNPSLWWTTSSRSLISCAGLSKGRGSMFSARQPAPRA